MEDITREEGSDGRIPIKDRLIALERKQREIEEEKNNPKKKKVFKWGFKAKQNINKFGKKVTQNQILCDYLNKQGIWEGPMYLPIVGGNLIPYKNKGHEYFPNEVTYRKMGTKVVPIYVMREIDRKPVSNTDWNAVRDRKDDTDEDELLLKMLLMAGIDKSKKVEAKGILWILGILVAVGIVAYVIFA